MLPSSLVITVLLCQFYFLTLLYLQTELFKKSAMQKEMDTLNLLYERQRQQYQVARQNVQIINRRCHELKVRIADCGISALPRCLLKAWTKPSALPGCTMQAPIPATRCWTSS